MARTGTYDFNDLAAITASPTDIGLDNLLPAFEAELAAHNAVVSSMVADLATKTTAREDVYGGASDGEMLPVDEYGDAPTQKTGPGGQVAFPLVAQQHNIGYTAEFMLKSSVAEMRTRMLAAETAHKRALARAIKRAIYGAANYTVVDQLGRPKGVTLTIRRLVNGDGQPLPAGPNGETYDAGTETHYTAEAALTAAGLRASIRKVLLKGFDANPMVAINLADAETVSALTGFSPTVVVQNNVTVISQTGGVIPVADRGPTGNRMIGTFDDVPVYVKPWALPQRAFTYDAGAAQKVLAMREETIESLRGLRMTNPTDSGLKAHPLYAELAEARFGFGAYNRAAGAVHEWGSGTSYTDPVIS